MKNLIKILVTLLVFQSLSLSAEPQPTQLLLSQHSKIIPLASESHDDDRSPKNSFLLLTSLQSAQTVEPITEPKVTNKQEAFFEIEEPEVLFLIGMALILFGLFKGWYLKKKKLKAFYMDER